MKLDQETFSAQVRVSLVFQAADPFRSSGPQPVCLFPLSTVNLNVLDFIEPSTLAHLDEKKKATEVLGFVKTSTQNPLETLFQRSWHRGFTQLLPHFVLDEVIVRCGMHPVRVSLKEEANQTHDLWILRIDAMNEKLLSLLRAQLYTAIHLKNSPMTENDIIRIPTQVIAHLKVQSLFFNSIFFQPKALDLV